MPTIGELIRSHMDQTGHSYGDLSRRTGDVLGVAHLQKLVTKPIKEFPKPTTVTALAELLGLPVTTVVLAFAASLGLPVRQSGTMLEVTLPPGTDSLTVQDREAVRTVTAALIDARRSTPRPVAELHPPMPDLSRAAARRGESEGQRRRREQDRDAES